MPLQISARPTFCNTVSRKLRISLGRDCISTIETCSGGKSRRRAVAGIPERRAESADAYRKAVSLARSQLEVNPRDANAMAYIAEYSAMLGDRKTANESINIALALAPSDPTAMFRAALIDNRFGNDERAILWLDRATKAGIPRANIRDTPDFDHLQKNADFIALTSVR